MTTQELRELDAWIAENVMGKKVFHAASAHGSDWWWSPHEQCVMKSPEEWATSDRRSFKPTTSPADAMAVLKKCMKASPVVTLSVWDKRVDRTQDTWVVGSPQSQFDLIKAETIELAICLFARELFSQPKET